MSKLLAGAFAALLLIAPTLAHDYKVGSLQIAHPWSRATPKGAAVGGGYLTITNNGSTPDRLIGGSTPVAKEFELHQMSNDNGVMKMRPVEGGLEIKPGETVTLKPSGYHIMFVDLAKPLKQGDRVPATLDFAKAGKVQVEFAVEGMGATHGNEAGGPMPGMGGHDMSGMAGQHGH
jgi:copper(I)-binding protein